MEKIVEKTVSEKEIKRVVREYLQRIAENVNKETYSISDERIDCPQCRELRCIDYGEYVGISGWQCPHCLFTFSEDLVPPIPEAARAFFIWQEKINMFLKSK